MLDANTLRKLARNLRDPAPERCRAAVELVSEGPPQLATATLAAAIRDAPASTRSLLVAALDRVLEADPAAVSRNARAARDLAQPLTGAGTLSERDRADLVQAYGRLTASPGATRPDPVLTAALAHRAPAVRLAASAARYRETTTSPDSFQALLTGAAASDDAVLRRTARKETRALLLDQSPVDPDALFDPLLRILTGMLDRAEDRADAAEALAEVARRHPQRARAAAEAMLAIREDDDPRVRAAILRFVGRAGLREHAGWLAEHLIADGDRGGILRQAARDGLRELGSDATEALLADLSSGRRRVRDAVLPLVRELPVDAERLRSAYCRELDTTRLGLVQLGALQYGTIAEIVLQRLRERFEEGLRTLLHLLAAIHKDDRILAVAEQLRRAHSERRHAVLLEALDALLPQREKAELIPLLEGASLSSRSRRAAQALGIPMPSAESAAGTLLDDPDRLTRQLARATAATLDGGSDLLEDPGVGSHVERALLLKDLQPFQSLTTRQLVHVAERMREQVYSPGTLIVAEGSPVGSLYLIADGDVTIRRSDAVVAELGPGGFFGEIAVFDAAHKSPTAASTQGGARLLGLTREHLIEAMEDMPDIAVRLCESLSRRILDLTDGTGKS
jgi:hypothetical protein